MTKRKGAAAGNEINMPQIPGQMELFQDMEGWLKSLPDIEPPPDFREAKLEHSPIVLMAHPKKKCKGKPCALHNRSDHSMRSFMQHWRDDRGIIERICPHGIGHPDPDQEAYLIRKYGSKRAWAEFVHGCDGCCRTDKEL